MASPSRARLFIVAIALAALVGAVLVARGRGGGKTSKPSAATGADPWASGAAATDPGKPGLALPALSSKLGLRMRGGGPPVTVSGTVRLAPGGTPVAEAEVAFMSELGENTAISDGSGRYTIRVASAIRWKVHARTDRAVGYPEALEPTADTVRDLDVHPTSIVRGKVVDTRGAAIDGATVNIEVEAADRALLEAAMGLSTVADAGGRFELRSVPGSLKVRASKGLVQGVAQVSALAPGDTIDLTITVLEPITIDGRVVDGAGAPVAGAKVLCAATLAPGGPTDRLTFETGADGSFVARAPAGWVRFEARKDFDLSPAVAQQYTSGERRALTLTLAAPASLRGKVIAADGTPVIGAKVRLVANAVYDGVSNSDGSFEIGAPGGQSYLVKVKHSDGYAERTIAAWNDEPTFVLRRFGAVTVSIKGEPGAVTAQIDSFVPAGERTPRAPAEARFRGLTGQVTLTSLEPGTYDLTVATEAAGATRVPRVVVDDGAVRTITVALAAPVPVRGVVEANRQPIAGAQVTIGARTAFSDSKGRWLIPAVAAGPASITVVKTGFGTTWASTVAAPDAEPVAIELRPDGAATVDGVGVVVAPAASGAIVTHVLPGSPAEGKLSAGDVISSVDGTDVGQAAIDDIIARLRGSAGSSVSITVQRGADSTRVDVVRRHLVVPAGTGAVALTRTSRVVGGGPAELASAGEGSATSPPDSAGARC